MQERIVVKYLSLEVVRREFDAKDVFAFREDKPHRWLQRFCFWILEKLEAYKKEASIEYKTHVIETDKILDYILESKVNLRSIYNEEARYIVLGLDAYSKLDIELQDQMLCFEMPRFDLGRGAEFKEVHGLIVVLVPWLTGCFVLPKLPYCPDYGIKTHYLPAERRFPPY